MWPGAAGSPDSQRPWLSLGRLKDPASRVAPKPAGEAPGASLWSGFLSVPVICNSFVPLIYQELKDDSVKKVEEQIIYIIELFSSFLPLFLPPSLLFFL